MTSELLIRPATENDAEVLGRLGALLVQQHHSFDERRFLAPTPRTAEHYASFLATQMSEADAIIMVAEVDGRVIGYAYGTIEGHDWISLRGPAALLHDLLVDPNERNRAVGKTLLNAMIDAFTSRGVPRVVLGTAERNIGAQRFFERAMFRRTMVEMTRELKASD
ncbi:MAG: GNAT family N-acetyltransferase [Vicinamibacteria bacterium]